MNTPDNKVGLGSSSVASEKKSDNSTMKFIAEWAAVLICVSSMLFTQVGIGAYLVITKDFIAETFNIAQDAGEQSWWVISN